MLKYLDKLFGTIILERVIDFIFLFSLIAITFTLKFDLFLSFLNQLIDFKSIPFKNIILGFLFFSIAVLLIVYLSKKWIKKTTFYKKIATFLIGVKKGVLSINQLKDKWTFWIHTFIIWLMYLLMTYVCFFAIDQTSALTLIDGLYTMVIGGLGMVAPVQGGLGAYHYVVKLGLMELGIDSNPALLFATVVHTAQTLMTLAFGGVSILMVFLQKRRANE